MCRKLFCEGENGMKQKLCKWLVDNGAVFTENLYYKYSGTKSALYRFCEENGIGVKAGRYDGFYKCFVDDNRTESGKRVLCVVQIVKPYRKPVDANYKIVVNVNGNIRVFRTTFTTYKELRKAINLLRKQDAIKTIKIYSNDTEVAKSLWK